MVCASIAEPPSGTLLLRGETAMDEDRLDEEAFPRFSVFLHASQSYATLSGCRFRSSFFDDLDDTCRRDCPDHAAKLKAAPAAREFSERLLAREEGLEEEIERAYRIVMVESVRNAMQGMFKMLDMMPPNPPPRNVDDEDCSYEDVTEPLPVIAQRLYNDSVRRVIGGTDGFGGRLQRRAMTAAYLTDFAEIVGYPLPPVPETQQSMLAEFSSRVSEELKERGGDEAATAQARKAFLDGLGVGAAAESLRREAHKWWRENRTAVLFGMVGAVALGVVAVAATSLGRDRQQASRAEEDEDQRAVCRRR